MKIEGPMGRFGAFIRRMRPLDCLVYAAAGTALMQAFGPVYARFWNLTYHSTWYFVAAAVGEFVYLYMLAASGALGIPSPDAELDFGKDVFRPPLWQRSIRYGALVAFYVLFLGVYRLSWDPLPPTSMRLAAFGAGMLTAPLLAWLDSSWLLMRRMQALSGRAVEKLIESDPAFAIEYVKEWLDDLRWYSRLPIYVFIGIPVAFCWTLSQMAIDISREAPGPPAETVARPIHWAMIAGTAVSIMLFVVMWMQSGAKRAAMSWLVRAGLALGPKSQAGQPG